MPKGIISSCKLCKKCLKLFFSKIWHLSCLLLINIDTNSQWWHKYSSYFPFPVRIGHWWIKSHKTSLTVRKGIVLIPPFCSHSCGWKQRCLTVQPQIATETKAVYLLLWYAFPFHPFCSSGRQGAHWDLCPNIQLHTNCPMRTAPRLRSTCRHSLNKTVFSPTNTG